MFEDFTSWRDPTDGMWLGYWNDYPKYPTEGYSPEDLKRMLDDIRDAILDGVLNA